MPSKKIIKNNNKGKRTWYATSEIIEQADIQKTMDCSECYLLSVLKTKNEKGYNEHNYHLKPDWNVNFNKINVKKDQLDFMTIVKDSLLQHKPKITILLNDDIKLKNKKCNKLTGILQGIFSINTQNSKADRKPHAFHLYIKFDKSMVVPEDLTNFKIKMSSDLISDPYVYGYCNRMSGRHYVCSDEAYITNEEYINLFTGKRRCRAFDTRKGNPSMYCSFSTGT